jgi:hypothetical protein
MKKSAQFFCLVSTLSLLIFAGDSMVEKMSSETKKIVPCKEQKSLLCAEKKSPQNAGLEKIALSKEQQKKIESTAKQEVKKVAEIKKKNRYAIKKDQKNETASAPAETTVVAQVVIQEKKIEQVDAKKEARTIEIKNCITKDMITYHHWTGKHTPEFNVKVNGKEVKEAVSASIPVANDKVNIEYSFNFANGYYKDTKKLEVAVPEGNQFALEFSWKTTPNIKIAAVTEKKNAPGEKSSGALKIVS